MDNYKRIGILTVFAISMAFFESAIVVYLRELYYPLGFAFPLKQMSSKIAMVEIMREFYSIIMLIAVAFITGKHKTNRFAVFIYCFGIWDIFYYVFLKFIINWPESFFTWDVLFLIPTIWTSPVIAPIIVSVSMIILAVIIFYKNLTDKMIGFSLNEFIILIIGALIIFISFIWDYSHYVYQYFSFSEIFKNINNPDLAQVIFTYIPQKFNWFYFWIGEGVILIAILLYSFNNKNNN